MPHTVHLGRVVGSWLGDIQVATGCRFRAVGVRHVLVQRLDQAAAKVVRGEEA